MTTAVVAFGAHWRLLSRCRTAGRARLSRVASVAKTLVTGASGFLGSHLARALAERGDDLRLLARRSSKLGHLDGLEFERATGDVTDRRAVRRAMEGVDRVFHVAGPDLAARRRTATAVFDTNVRGARLVFEEALEAGVERVVHTSTAGAIGVAKPKRRRRRDDPVRDRPSRIAYVNSKHEAELEALRARRPRPAGRDRQPVLRARPRRPEPDLDGPGAALPASARSRPTSTARSTSSTSATSPPATCSPTRRARSASATSSAGATSPSTACSPTWPGSPASRPRR